MEAVSYLRNCFVWQFFSFNLNLCSNDMNEEAPSITSADTNEESLQE